MPVRGIGIDVCKVERIAESLQRFGARMERRLFTPDELAYCRGFKDPLPHLAARFAAKRAFSERKPMPGWIASAPVMVAAEMIAGMLR